MPRSRRNRIALGCSISACVMIIAAGAVSAFWTVTYGKPSWGVRFDNGNLLAKWIDYEPGWGSPVARGLSIEDAYPRGFDFVSPEINRSAGRYFDCRLPLWLPLAVLALPTFILWRRSRRRILPGHCQQCGYDLTGNVSGKCSECGAKVNQTPMQTG